MQTPTPQACPAALLEDRRTPLAPKTSDPETASLIMHAGLCAVAPRTPTLTFPSYKPFFLAVLKPSGQF